ncbi:MAG TPA: Rid family hydrolase, partial [Methyloceanibacter sp.]|nr:Rid family hydrolase [Methyloceanibacter sp.]
VDEIYPRANHVLKARSRIRQSLLDDFENGASLKDVIRTRIYLTDIAHWEAAGRVHGEFFAEIRPASTMIEVSRFINPDWLVEIEADAVIGES